MSHIITLLSNKILLKNFLNDSLDEKWPIILILGIFFLTIVEYEPSKRLLWSIMLKTFSNRNFKYSYHVGYSYKILLKNIEGGTKMMGTYKLSFSSFLLSIWLIMT